ncbi:L-sorbose 1-phosphate reductase [Soehngenia saccharolytica]|nr:L-sorbose 1-phosphate reductase [Soehngenia saccharolytica]
MKTKAVRLYGANDLRLEEFELPEIKDDEILVEIISDSICMSTYKCAILGEKHKRVPKDVSENPIIIGHEFAGNIVKVGKKWQDQFKPGTKFAQQPALNYKGSMASPGYSYMYFGGDATYAIVPPEVMELGCLINYKGDAYYEASLAEPMSCIIGAYHATYHTEMGKYTHFMGIKDKGNLAILAGAGPMGLGTIDYALHGDKNPKLVVVTDVDSNRLERAREIFEDEANKCGIKLIFVNTKEIADPDNYLMEISEGHGYDDVFAMAPVREVVEQADRILARDGCLNFFAGPTDTNFKGEINFYNVHYNSTHVMGTTGGNTDDLIESLKLTENKKINPACMVTHIGGLDSVIETTLNLPKILGGKKLIYTQINMPLTAIEDFREKAKEDKRFEKLAEIVENNKGLWSVEAEKYLLENFR